MPQDIRDLARQEPRRLLHGTPARQDLIGLLTAARGGVSASDLAHLTGEPSWEIEELLHGVSGRAFTHRASQWQPEAAPEVYLLGHEKLQATARIYLGEERITGYGDRLHAWAQDYRAQAWPDGTPEYLLRGYFRMLTATGDTTRMVACATDKVRHERMSDITRGDAAALNEVTTTLELIATHDSPDLIAALKLARHRDYLADRNSNVPADLPAVWAALGHHIRADALARSITDPYCRTEALVGVARALAQAGQTEKALGVATQSEAAARNITNPGMQAAALAAVAGVLAQAGLTEKALGVATQSEAAARNITNPGMQAAALAAVSQELARAGQANRPLPWPAPSPTRTSWRGR